MRDILNDDKGGILPVGITSEPDRLHKARETEQGCDGTVEVPRPTWVLLQGRGGFHGDMGE